jgi:hypothetical protein
MTGCLASPPQHHQWWVPSMWLHSRMTSALISVLLALYCADLPVCSLDWTSRLSRQQGYLASMSGRSTAGMPCAACACVGLGQWLQPHTAQPDLGKSLGVAHSCLAC